MRIRVFVLLPDHTCLRAARRQVHGIWTFDVNVRHERFNCIGISMLFMPACASRTQTGGLYDVLHRESHLIKGARGLYNSPEKTQPPVSPFLKGDLNGIT